MWNGCLRKHTHIVHYMSNIICNKCTNQNQNQGALHRHSLVIHKENKLHCTLCDYRLSWKWTLKQHKQCVSVKRPLKIKTGLGKPMMLHTRLLFVNSAERIYIERCSSAAFHQNSHRVKQYSCKHGEMLLSHGYRSRLDLAVALLGRLLL